MVFFSPLWERSKLHRKTETEVLLFCFFRKVLFAGGGPGCRAGLGSVFFQVIWFARRQLGQGAGAKRRSGA